jgi:hypothetical protein
MAATILYDGTISGGAIAATIACSGANVISIPYANGMRVLLIAN